MIKPSLQTVESHGEKPEQDDPFDLSKLRLDQSFAETVGVKKLLRTVPVRKPNSQDFIRVNPDPNYRATFSIVDLHDEREIYLVTQAMTPELMGECTAPLCSPASIGSVGASGHQAARSRRQD
jgi:hypothetical protein